MMNEPKPKRVKKQYDEAFRRSAVALGESSGRSLQEIATELGVTHWNLRDWTKKHGRNQPRPTATPTESSASWRGCAGRTTPGGTLRDPKKSAGHPCRTIRERCVRMKALHGQYRIGELGAAFGVSRSGYHRWRTAAASVRTREDVLLSQTLRTLHALSRGTYGRPRLCAALRRAGRRHSPKRIARLMRTLGLRGVQRGGFRPQTTASRHGLQRVPHRLLGAAPPNTRDQLWVADITFVPTGEGWLYVAGVLDRHSRRVLGLAFGARRAARLPEAARRVAHPPTQN